MTDSLKLPPQEPITALQSPAILPLKEENNEKIEPVPVSTLSEIKQTRENQSEEIILPIKRSTEINSTIFGATFMLTNICLGTTIFTFAVRAKAFGLVWILIACFICGAVNYWTITRGVASSEKLKESDYSEITEKLLGKKGRLILNILIIIYSYACIMCFLALIYPLFGRFIMSIGYRNKYNDFEEFKKDKWGKSYIKFPIFIVIAVILSLECLIKDINKLNFSAYLGVIAVIYTLIIITIQCDTYYNHYKKNEYVENDKSTHVNWTHLEKAFTSDLDFFKGMASLFAAYSCITGVFPVYEGFKHQENGLNKMKKSVFFSVCLTTALHVISITCSYLTEPIYPEDVIIYRKPKEHNDKDILMNIAKLMITGSLIFTLPGYYFGLRLCVANSFTGGNISNKFNYIFTFVSIFICSFIAAIYDKILNYLIYIGGFISVFVCYLFPILLYIKSTGKPITYWKNLIEFIGALILVAIGITAGILTIRDDIKK
jgi:amino acid permease